MTKFNNFNFKNFYKKYFNLDSEKLLRIMIKDFFYKRIAVTSSFGAESAVILHLVSKIDNNTPIIFLNTMVINLKNFLLSQDKKSKICLIIAKIHIFEI